MRIDGAVVLVTGASAGIGRAVAERLVAGGARVLVHGRDPARTRAVATAVGGTPLIADLAESGAPERLADQAGEAAAGRLDACVLNAGIGWSGPFTTMSPEKLRSVLAVDLAAPVALSRQLLPGMLARGSGRLCFVTSIAGRTGVAGEAVYAAAKAGLDAFAESLRAEAVGSGVGVSVVVPGVVDTGFFAARGRPYTRARPKPLPVGRVAGAVVGALASDRDEVWVPRWLAIAPAVRSLVPAAYRRLTTRFGERERLQ
jgi:short-subunit dehydrogenase